MEAAGGGGGDGSTRPLAMQDRAWSMWQRGGMLGAGDRMEAVGSGGVGWRLGWEGPTSSRIVVIVVLTIVHRKSVSRVSLSFVGSLFIVPL